MGFAEVVGRESARRLQYPDGDGDSDDDGDGDGVVTRGDGQW